ncbi:MAG: hypothetical protein ACJA1A_001562 [Saprospiraceae bacterium]|jgi:uncharacterized protein (DUF983 family)
MATLANSIFSKKCPRCRESKLFIEPMMLNKPLDMNERCPVCGQNFLPEPGFYYGAMFISYLISSFFFLFVAGITIIYFDFSVEGAFALIIFLGLFLYLWLMRISRSIWIHIMIKYDSTAKDNYKERNFS